MGMEGLPTSPEPGGACRRQRAARQARKTRASYGRVHGCRCWDFPSFPSGAVQQFIFTLIVSVNSRVSDLEVLHHVKADSLATFEIIY